MTVESESFSHTQIRSTAVVGAAFRRLIGSGPAEPDDPASVTIGAGSYVGHYTIIGKGCSLDTDCIVDDFCYVQSGVTIGSHSLVTHRAQVCSGVVIGSGCVIGGFIGDNVVIGNRVRSFGKIIHRQSNPAAPWDADESREVAAALEDSCFVAFDALVIGSVRIGVGSYVTANAVVTRDVPAYHVAVGVNNVIPLEQWQGTLARAGEELNEESRLGFTERTPPPHD
jgi:UDP-2-acetamido-3-amino-2,3-dideoxy-glucuronate N-acetyltransferase